MIGKTLSHYRIVERIGAGGMGIVHRAWDERLSRDVALKVLPAGALADPSARERFRNEALALSRLNHPHIATIYDLDHQNGIDFLVMEYIPGETLAEKLRRGPLAGTDAASLGCQVAEALEEAHEQGVVHRDLKSDNIVVTPKGWVKVLDFGLASLCGPVQQHAETMAVTDENVVAGTLPYMAPEQLLKGTADARTDLYSLGVILYELATGQRPFRERLATALINEVCTQPPEPPRRVEPGITPFFEGLILKLLEKDPARRYQTARELSKDLRRACSSGPTSFAASEGDRATMGRIQSIAVLPLENLSHDPEEEYFADGMTEALIAGLAKLGALRVISRTSVMGYKGTRAPLPEIARALNVDAVVEGAVLRSGNRVRITALLIEAATDRNLWAETYERDLGDILALQSELAQAIAGEIRVKITPQEEARLTRARAVDPGAYEAYLRGRYHWEKRSEEGLKRALEHFHQAIERDPAYATAYAGLADYYITLGNFSLVPSRDAFPKAKAAALKALQMDPTSAEALTSLGSVLGSYEWDRKGAEESFRKAIQLNPNYVTARHWHADHLISLGRFDEGIVEGKRAMELDPLSLILGADLGGYYFYARRYDDAVAQIRKTLELDPDYASAVRQLGGVLEQMGRYGEAIAVFEKSRELTGNATYSLTALAHAHALAGHRDEALRRLEELAEIAKRKYVSAYGLAAIHVALGDPDRAFEWLGQAADNHDRALIWLRVAPRFDALRGDPRFAALMRLIGAE